MALSAEDLAGIRDAHCVVRWGVQNQQRPAQRTNLLVQIDRAHVLDEVPPQGEGLATDQKGRLAIGENSFHEGVDGLATTRLFQDRRFAL